MKEKALKLARQWTEYWAKNANDNIFLKDLHCKTLELILDVISTTEIKLPLNEPMSIPGSVKK